MVRPCVSQTWESIRTCTATIDEAHILLAVSCIFESTVLHYDETVSAVHTLPGEVGWDCSLRAFMLIQLGILEPMPC